MEILNIKSEQERLTAFLESARRQACPTAYLEGILKMPVVLDETVPEGEVQFRSIDRNGRPRIDRIVGIKFD